MNNTDIDSNIIIRLTKEKKSVTSYIFNLEKFFSEEEIEKFKTDNKKEFGTRCVERQLQENKKTYKIIGFGGDHRDKIKEKLISMNIDESKIVVKM